MAEKALDISHMAAETYIIGAWRYLSPHCTCKPPCSAVEGYSVGQ